MFIVFFAVICRMEKIVDLVTHLPIFIQFIYVSALELEKQQNQVDDLTCLPKMHVKGVNDSHCDCYFLHKILSFCNYFVKI